MSTVFFDDSILDRMVLAVERVRSRLNRAVTVLEAAGLPYAVVGGNAVAAHVARVDASATRNTPDIDILVRRDDWNETKRAMDAAGFTHTLMKGLNTFLDGPDAKPRDAVHLLFAGERVRPDDLAAAASIDETELTKTDWSVPFRVVSLDALVRMKLTSYRDKDRTHLRDMIEVGLVDATWPAKFVPELGVRLQAILDTPEG